MKENWQKTTFGNIGKFKTSSVDKKSKNNEKIIKLVNYMDVYSNKEINNNWQLTRLDNNSTLNNLKKHEDLYMQKYAKIKLKQIKRRGKGGVFNGHHKDKCYETILNDIM